VGEHDRGPGTVPAHRFRRIDAVCDTFEDELLAGKRPAIEEYLLLVPEGDREPLRAQLLRLQEYYLKGEQDTVSDGTPATTSGRRRWRCNTRTSVAWSTGTTSRTI
jgi:hypothetical protein